MSVINLKLLEAADLPHEADKVLDPYVILWTTGNRSGACRSTTKEKSNAPNWNEDFKLHVVDFSKETLMIHVLDKASGEGIGFWRFPIAPIKQNVLHNLWLSLHSFGKTFFAGKIHVNIHVAPVTVAAYNAPPQTFVPYNLNINVEHAVDVPNVHVTASDPYVSFSIDGGEVYQTRPVKNTTRPLWDKGYSIPLTTTDSVINLKLFHNSSKKDKEDEVISFMDIPLGLFEVGKVFYDYYILAPYKRKSGGFLALRIHLAPANVIPFSTNNDPVGDEPPKD
uniref:C2 domain-containing protein n=1 Tax=Coptotermes formosanus TaxID=36987 RepID=R4V3N0_COPFO|nr:C2 domain-containing protein [Coptotermes formosanus]